MRCCILYEIKEHEKQEQEQERNARDRSTDTEQIRIHSEESEARNRNQEPRISTQGHRHRNRREHTRRPETSSNASKQQPSRSPGIEIEASLETLPISASCCPQRRQRHASRFNPPAETSYVAFPRSFRPWAKRIESKSNRNSSWKSKSKEKITSSTTSILLTPAITVTLLAGHRITSLPVDNSVSIFYFLFSHCFSLSLRLAILNTPALDDWPRLTTATLNTTTLQHCNPIATLAGHSTLRHLASLTPQLFSFPSSLWSALLLASLMLLPYSPPLDLASTLPCFSTCLSRRLHHVTIRWSPRYRRPLCTIALLL